MQKRAGVERETHLNHKVIVKLAQSQPEDLKSARTNLHLVFKCVHLSLSDIKNE